MQRHILLPVTNPDVNSIHVREQYSLIPDQRFTLAGGKGFNVARALRIFGQNLQVVALVGNDANEFFAQSLREMGITISTLLPQLVATRQTTTRIDGQVGFLDHDSVPRRSTLCSAEVWDAFLAAVDKKLCGASAMILSGKPPELAPSDAYARAISLAREQGIFTALDTRGRFLQETLHAMPDLIKPNIEEVLDATGQKRDSEPLLDDMVDLAMDLLREGARCVAVSGAAQGAILVDKDGWTKFYVPPQHERNPVGSGDTMVGIATYFRVSRGYSMVDAVRMGVAAAAAQVDTTVPGHFDLDRANILAGRIEISGKRFGLHLVSPGLASETPPPLNSRFLSVANRDPRFRLDEDRWGLLKPREDAVLVTRSSAVIADGMTLSTPGHYQHPSASAEAARIFCDTIAKKIGEYDPTSVEKPETRLRTAFFVANKKIGDFNQSRSKEERNRYGIGGAIGIGMLIRDDELHLMHIGDASSVMVMEDGSVVRLTKPQDGVINQHLAQFSDRRTVFREKMRFLNIRPGSEGGRAFGALTGSDIAMEYLEYIRHPLKGVEYIIMHTDGFDNLTDEMLCKYARGEIDHRTILEQNHAERAWPKHPKSDDRTITVIDIVRR